MKLGDANTHYFFRGMKERSGDNCINFLQDSSGATLTLAFDTQNEVVQFYKNLMSCLRCIILTPPVLHSEIDDASKSIDDNKA